MTAEYVSQFVADPSPIRQVTWARTRHRHPGACGSRTASPGGTLHTSGCAAWGAVMALADTLGAIATVANLAEGATTTTIESRTNFFAAIPVGDTARAECTPLHRAAPPWCGRPGVTR